MPVAENLSTGLLGNARLRRRGQMGTVTGESSGKRAFRRGAAPRKYCTMAERQETSVMVSIQEILQDAQSREEQEKLQTEQRAREAEQRRLEDIRRKQDDEAARLRAQEEDRERRSFEEQRRQAELQALQEATIHRAKAEAESQARLAEMSSRQDHERQLHALSQDKHKKRVQMIAVALGVFFFVGAIGAGVVIKNVMDQKNAAEARANQLETEKQEVEQQTARVQAELEQTKDPQKIDALQKQLAAEQKKLEEIRTAQASQTEKRGVPGGAAVGIGSPTPKGKPAGDKPRPVCNCTPGDPLCSCL
jgi:colicin import membrane protein